MDSHQNAPVLSQPPSFDRRQPGLSSTSVFSASTTSWIEGFKNPLEPITISSNGLKGTSTPEVRGNSSRSVSPPSLKHPNTLQGLQTARNFPSDASIVLIGIRGTGKSSLGYLASSALRRQLVDADQYFYRNTGFSRAAYRRDHSAAAYRSCEFQVLRSMLMENDKNSVIACGPGCVEEYGGEFLREYAKSHPVVHVLREQQAIQKYLKITEGGRMAHLLEISEPMYRACSNFEFYNLMEVQQPAAQDDREPKNEELVKRFSPSTPFLALKYIERDFLRFIGFITHHEIDPQTANPLSVASYVSPEYGTYSYALLLPLSKLVDGLDIESLETGVDAIELSIDVSLDFDLSRLESVLSARNISRQLARLRRKTNVPIIFSVQKEPLQSLSLSAPSAISDFNRLYFDLLHYGLRLGVEYLAVDVGSDEEEIRRLVAEKGSTKVIGHFSDEQTGADGWDHPNRLERYHSIRLLGCDVVRLTQRAASMEDNFALLRFRKRIESLDYSHPPLIAYNTGAAGRVSYCFGPFMTPVTHSLLRTDGSGPYSTMITAQEAQKSLYANFVLDKMHFCTYGAAVTYSLTPAMHGAAAEACGMPHTWRVYDSSSLRDLVALCEDPNFGGASVSLPFKIEVISLLHSMSWHAKVIGAVNTVIPIRELADQGLPKDLGLRAQRNRAGPFKALHGDNTDWIGIRSCIRRNLSPANSITDHTSGVVIGAGGMARAAIYAMLKLGVLNIFIYNRTHSNAVELAEHYNRQGRLWGVMDGEGVAATLPPDQSKKHKIHVLESLQDPWPKPYRQPTIVVCCIPAHSIGDQPAPNFKMPTQWFQSRTGGVVIELAYKILNTALLQQVWAEVHRGWIGVDGLDVLPEQGFAQFELLTGRNGPRRLMREEVLRNYIGEEGYYNSKGSVETRLASIYQNSDTDVGN